MSRQWLLAVLAGVSACVPDLDLPPGVTILCADNDDCPATHECNRGVCTLPGVSRNTPPSVVIEPISRTTGDVTIRVTVLDAEEDEVSLTAALDEGAGYQAITIVPDTVSSLAQGNAVELLWSAPFATPDLRRDLQLRITPHDSEAGVPATTVFAWGNNAPRLEAVSMNADPVSGLVVVRFTVSDDTFDSVAIDSFVIDHGGVQTALPMPPESADFPTGALQNLATSPCDAAHPPPCGVEHTFAWDSGHRPELRITEPSATLTLTVSDGRASLPFTTSAFAFDNNQRPEVASVQVLEATDRPLTGPVGIVYRVIDAESDPVDIDVEVTTDGGVSWERAAEYVQPASEGRYDLESAPASAGGVEHVFVWDTSAARLVSPLATTLRIRVTDGRPRVAAPNETTVPLAAPLGPSPSAIRDELFAPPACLNIPEVGMHAATLSDLDGNGLVDAVFSSSEFGSTTPSTLTIFLAEAADGQPAGTFTTAAPVQLPSGIGVVTAAHLDDDPTMDLAVGFGWGAEPTEVHLLFGDGTGGFVVGSQTLPLFPYQPAELAAADLDGDGDLDLVARALGDFTLRYALSEGIGSFGPVQSRALGSHLGAMVVEDVTGDGVLDVVTTHVQGPILQVSVGHSTAPQSYNLLDGPTLDLEAEQAGLAAGDLDGDGDVDLVSMTSVAPISITTYVNAGNGEFSPVQSIAVAATYARLELLDANGDGRLDIGGGVPDGLVIALNQGLDALGQPRFDELAAIAGADTELMTLQDTGLARGPMLIATGYLKLCAYRPAAAWDLGQPVEGFLPVNRARRFDTDADGIDDLVGAWGGVVVRGGVGRRGLTGDGSYTAGTIYSGTQLGASDVQVADLNGDGAADVVALVGWEVGFAGEILVLHAELDEGIPTGSFVEEQRFVGAEDPIAAVVHDFDDDGAQDVAVLFEGVLSDPGQVWVLSGDGSGGFDETPLPEDIYVLDGAGGMRGIDIDGNGALDLLVSNVANGRLDLLLGQAPAGIPNGQFTAMPSLVTGLSTSGTLAVVDLDDDGVSDVLMDNGIGTSRLRGGSGGVADGTLQAPTPLDLETAYTGILVADFTGDGVLDIGVHVQVFPSELVLAEGIEVNGLGTGDFASPLHRPSIDPSGYASAVDLDDSGGVDILAGSAASFHDNAERLRKRSRVPASGGLNEPGLQLVGSSMARAGRDRFDEPHLNRVTFHQVNTPYVRGAFIDEARAALPTLPPRLKPLTRTFRVGGALRFSQVTTASGPRLKIEPRFGFDAQGGGTPRGFDLSSGTVSAQRGLIVELPILPGRGDSEIQAGQIVVVYRRRDWRRAAAVLSDPLSGQSDAEDYVPRISDGAGGFRDVILEDPTWSSVPETAALNVGSGVRWVLDNDTAQRRVIRVLLDADGDLQAFLASP